MPDFEAAGDTPSKAMTYGELAAALDMKEDSARKMAARRGWRKVPGNDGFLRVLVPLDILPPVRDERPPDGERRLNETLLSLARLEAENAALRDRLADIDRARADLDRARAESDRWFSEYVRLRDQAEALAMPPATEAGAFNWRGWWRRRSP